MKLWDRSFSRCIGVSVKIILADPDSPAVLRHEKEIDELAYQLYGLPAKEVELVARSST